MTNAEEYSRARNKGMKEVHALQLRHEEPTLPVLAELVPNLNRLSQVPLGVVQISIDQIVGTATKGRTTAFSRSFYPLLESDSEFASKWIALYDSVQAEGLREPVKAYEYYNRFYIIEGNKRVSVCRYLDAVYVEADVIRILPEHEDSKRYRLYQEYLRFFADTRIQNLAFDHEGDFARLYDLMGKTPGVPWTTEDKFDFQSFHYRFTQAYAQQEGSRALMGVDNAMLVYMEIYGYANSINKVQSEIKLEIKRIHSEFVVVAAGKPAALINQPAEKQHNLLTSVLRKTPQTLRCAFLYNRSPQLSGWTYWHELGRRALEETFGSRVQTTFRENVAQEDALAVIEELVAEGIQVIFAASPVFLDACIRASATHPEVKILNCSLLASYHNVRSYYLRIYEAKFVLGAIAGAMTENDKIGYIADYPIYGVPASINAFALGAQMTNPRAKIHLEWSTIPGLRPEEVLAANDVRLISGRDISAPHMESRAFGLYRQEENDVRNIAMPVWNWQKLYEGVVRSILTGAWAEEEAHHPDRAMSYYMGMSSDASDLLLSSKLPPRVRQLSEMLRTQIRNGDRSPIYGPICDQTGKLRLADGMALEQSQIIRMDYLAENVIGRIPKLDELSELARGLVSLQGLKSTTAGPTTAERMLAATSSPTAKED